MNKLVRDALLRAIWNLGAFKTSDHPTALSRGDERGFLLKAHEKNPDLPLSPFYLNLRTPGNPKPGPLTPHIVRIIARVMYMMADRDCPGYDAVAGIPNAGDPFAEAFASTLAVPLLKLGKATDVDKPGSSV